MVWKKITLPRHVRRALLLGVSLALASWLVFSFTEGWASIALWVIIALPACFAGEFLLREKKPAVRRSPKSLPRMNVRAPLTREKPRGRAAEKDSEADFPWHRDQPTRRQPRRGVPRR